MNQKVKVLVLDDDPVVHKLVKKILDEKDYVLEFSSSVDEALEKVTSFKPDIAVVDYHIPGKSGLDFCEAVKTHQQNEINSIHILGITARTDQKTETKMLNKGADDFIAKPFTSEDFIAKINVGKRISTKVKSTQHEFTKMFEEMEVLLIQDGGCAPGYNPVTAFLTNNLEQFGHKVYCAKEGFKSIVTGKNEDFVRLIYDHPTYKKFEHIKNVF